MIGNDIVDLKQAGKDSNWQRKGFLNKVFSEEEQWYINSAIDKGQMVWGLWSMKEAGYKAYVQQTGKRFLGPQKIKCKLLINKRLTASSKVFIEDLTFDVNTSLCVDYVNSVVTTSPKDHFNLKKSIFKIPASNYTDQHSWTYNHIYAFLSKEYGYETGELCIKKNSNGIPKLYLGDLPLPYLLSISHHGNYGSFVIEN